MADGSKFLPRYSRTAGGGPLRSLLVTSAFAAPFYYPPTGGGRANKMPSSRKGRRRMPRGTTQVRAERAQRLDRALTGSPAPARERPSRPRRRGPFHLLDLLYRLWVATPPGRRRMSLQSSARSLATAARRARSRGAAARGGAR